MSVRRWTLPLVLLLTVSVAAAGETDTGRISVYGTAVRQVEPNQMRWHLVVRNVSPESARGAAKAHESAVGAVLRFLKEGTGAAREAQTSGMRLGENWNHDRGSRVRDGFFASTDVTFTLSDIAQYSEVWTGLSDLPSVSVVSVDLDHSDRIKLQNEARTDAVVAAREKAQGIADALGVRLGTPLAVEEDLMATDGSRAGLQMVSNSVMTSGESVGADEFVAPGSIPIRSRVKVEFALIADQ